VDADGVEQFLFQKFSEFLCTVYSVDKDDHLVESQGVKQVGQFFKFFGLSKGLCTSLR